MCILSGAHGQLETAPTFELLSVRSGFRSFAESVVTLFQTITLEGWTFLMFDAMKVRACSRAMFFVMTPDKAKDAMCGAS